jgi:hypothetical protein
MSDDSVDVGAGAERAELRVLVGAALAGLNPGEREIIELNLRHDLDGADLADALGVSRNQAHALASRARSQFETSLGALLVARSGREDCPDLDAILAGWDGQLTVLLRKRVNRHIERCDVCGDRRRRQLSPAMLLSMLPVVMLPAGLRDQLFRLVADVGPAGSAYRARVIRRAEPFDGSGFPKPLDPPHPGGRLKVYAVAGVAAVVLLAVIGGGVVFAADIAHHSPPSASTLAGPPPTSSSPAVAPVVAPPSSSPPTSSAPATSAPPVVTTLPAPPAPPTTATPTPKHTTKPPPKPGTLTASTNLVVLAQSAAGGPYTGTFTLTATGGPIPKFTITDTAPAGDLSISPSSGSLKNGATVTVTVTVVSAANLSYQTPLTVNPGPLTVTVEYPPSG